MISSGRRPPSTFNAQRDIPHSRGSTIVFRRRLENVSHEPVQYSPFVALGGLVFFRWRSDGSTAERQWSGGCGQWVGPALYLPAKAKVEEALELNVDMFASAPGAVSIQLMSTTPAGTEVLSNVVTFEVTE